MEATSKVHLQNKAHSMIACLEFIKLDMKTNTEHGTMANGKRKLSMFKYWIWKVARISVNAAFWIFILYNIFF